MTLKGSCHCGSTKFEVTEAPETVTRCTCSFCSKRGALWAYYDLAHFTLLTPRDTVATYRWNSKMVAHNFCPTCGSTVYWEMDWAPDFIAIAVGAFADPNFPPPNVMVYENRMHPWALAAEGLGMERWG